MKTKVLVCQYVEVEVDDKYKIIEDCDRENTLSEASFIKMSSQLEDDVVNKLKIPLGYDIDDVLNGEKFIASIVNWLGLEITGMNPCEYVPDRYFD